MSVLKVYTRNRARMCLCADREQMANDNRSRASVPVGNPPATPAAATEVKPPAAAPGSDPPATTPGSDCPAAPPQGKGCN